MPEQIPILIADDDNDLRTSLNEELQKEGYQISTASNGKEALALLQSNKFDVAILDIKMPKVDGFEVLKSVKKEHPKMKVIMLTAYADLKNANLCKSLGADDVVEKPFEYGDLFSSIEYVLKK